MAIYYAGAFALCLIDERFLFALDLARETMYETPGSKLTSRSGTQRPVSASAVSGRVGRRHAASSKDRSSSAVQTKTRPLSAKRLNRPQSAKSDGASGRYQSGTIRPGSAKFRPKSATFTPPSLEGLFTRTGAKEVYGAARQQSPIDSAHASTMATIRKLREAKNMGKGHLRHFEKELERLETSISDTVRSAFARSQEESERQGKKFRERGAHVNRTAMTKEDGHDMHLILDASPPSNRKGGPRAEDIEEQPIIVNDKDFKVAIETLLSPPRKKATDPLKSFNATKIPHYAAKMHKKKDLNLTSSESEPDSDSDADYLITESYQERVQQAAFLDQMLAAHDINERRELRKAQKAKGKGKGYRQTLRDKMKDCHAVHRYTESLKAEQEGYSSVALLCESRIQEVIAHTSLVEELPDETRTGERVCEEQRDEDCDRSNARKHNPFASLVAAVVCDILLKLTPVFGRYDALVTTIVKELMRSVYKHFDKVYQGDRTNADMLLNLGSPYFKLHRTLDAEHTLAKGMLSHQTKRSKWHENSLERGQKVMKTVMRLWHGDKRAKVFRAWKSLLQHRLVSRDYTLNLFRRGKLRIWFHGWR